MAGSYGLFDAQSLTASSEYDDRYGTKIDTLQIHHATMISIDGLISLMQPGGRTVSANGAMANDGTLYEVVPATHRAFTSATSYDRRCITVECCNTTVDANWGISDATHRRLGKLAAQMFQQGLLGGLNRTYIIGHNEVPGTYATACPGPSMNLDLVVQYAKEYLTPTKKKVDTMPRTVRLVQGSGPSFAGITRLIGEGGKFIDYNETTQKDLLGSINRVLNGETVYAVQATAVAAEFAKVAPAAVELTPAQIADLAKVISASIKVTDVPLTQAEIQAIGAEVIRQQKLPGN